MSMHSNQDSNNFSSYPPQTRNTDDLSNLRKKYFLENTIEEDSKEERKSKMEDTR